MEAAMCALVELDSYACCIHKWKMTSERRNREKMVKRRVKIYIQIDVFHTVVGFSHVAVRACAIRKGQSFVCLWVYYYYYSSRLLHIEYYLDSQVGGKNERSKKMEWEEGERNERTYCMYIKREKSESYL